jgi:hypothetical protein
MIVNDFFVSVVAPIILTPNCILQNKEQNCLLCVTKCHSPRALCVKPYHGHKLGCPNYGCKRDCPPLAPMYDAVFNINNNNFALGISVDINEHIAEMKDRHPSWSERQIWNPLYWQGSIRKLLKEHINAFISENPQYRATLRPEAMGVDVVKTLENVDKQLKWYPSTIITKVAFLGIPTSDQYNDILI